MKRVVVVDDDPTIIELTSRFLERRGLSLVGKGKNGKEAVELYFDLKPDAICLDLAMPEYDGFYAAEKIRQKDVDANILIITGNGNQETIQKLEENNLKNVFYKPIDMKKLVDHIANF